MKTQTHTKQREMKTHSFLKTEGLIFPKNGGLI